MGRGSCRARLREPFGNYLDLSSEWIITRTLLLITRVVSFLTNFAPPEPPTSRLGCPQTAESTIGIHLIFATVLINNDLPAEEEDISWTEGCNDDIGRAFDLSINRALKAI